MADPRQRASHAVVELNATASALTRAIADYEPRYAGVFRQQIRDAQTSAMKAMSILIRAEIEAQQEEASNG